MKKLFLTGILLASIGFASNYTFASTWVCYRYVNGEPTGGFIKVEADSKEEAEVKALKEYKKLGYTLDDVKCK
jgi:hypothetical protein